VKIQKISIVFAGISALLTAAAHALVGQTHLTRILATSVEAIDSAVIFAVWQMVTVTLFVSGIGPLLLLLCKENLYSTKKQLLIGSLFLTLERTSQTVIQAKSNGETPFT